MKKVFLFVALCAILSCTEDYSRLPGPELIDSYVGQFNSDDNELYKDTFPNDSATAFLRRNIPIFECPDKELEEIYYFRWWTYRKHVRQTPVGYVITEFMPDVRWAGKYNTINCPAAFHFYEGRWMRERKYMADYARFWLSEDGAPRRYSFPIADALWNCYLIHRDKKLVEDLYEGLKDNFEAWDDHRDSTGLYWIRDGWDGMEKSITGRMNKDHTGYRPTINSYQYADAVALSKMARLLGKKVEAKTYSRKAMELKCLIDSCLWDPEDGFYKSIPRHLDFKASPTRELFGYVPWMYGIPGREKQAAWEQLFDPRGFQAPYGPTSAEQRDPGFKVVYEGHECQWNGPSWPFATSQTLKGMAVCLREQGEGVLTKERYLELLKVYARSQHLDGKCWIDENLNPFTGDWISRTLLKERCAQPEERGKDYNHSSFADLIISDLLGLQVDGRGRLSVDPLIPEGVWDWWCLRDVSVGGRTYTVVYDRDGSRYGLGKGLTIK